ncbi:ArsR/SmtB family transcription factor [Bartonella raoultii]|uniref:ArsR family transcriptional regulator n=1 Tax=Bartonella raoultii TaxID=1457020 RepID=A0ABS7I6P4_9HYPH|nr:ArsR family transcriptional regulator [Bartonella raoultii]MBX4335062.1 ArsR family transcriptional regulator [Bartonella raoultii]
MKKKINLDAMVVLLKAMAEINRLRILALLCHEDLMISDLTFILGHSQSYISRHLRFLYEVQLIERYQRGDKIYFKFCYDCLGKDITIAVISALSKHDLMLEHDRACLEDVKKQRQEVEKKDFLKERVQWDALRLSSITDHAVENALLEVIGDKPFETMLDIGIGTGSVLKLFSGLYTHAMEVTLESNVLHLSVGEMTFDLVTFYWSLYFLKSPEKALHEVVRILRPHGRLLIIDFVRREAKSSDSYSTPMQIGFLDLEIERWIKNVGLVLEQTVCLTPMQNKDEEGAMVKLWLARDPRLLIDDIKNKSVEFV